MGKVSKSGSKSQDDKKSQKKRQSITYKPSTSKRGDDKKKIRFHPGTVALREIHALQKRTHMLIQKRPFQLLVRNVMSTIKRRRSTTLCRSSSTLCCCRCTV